MMAHNETKSRSNTGKKESKKAEKKRLNEERRANKRKKKQTNVVSEQYVAQLERIASREPAAIAPLLAAHKWEQHACGNQMLGPSREWDAAHSSPLFNTDLHQRIASNVNVRGCTVAENHVPSTTTNPTPRNLYGPPNPSFNWGTEYNDILLRVDQTMDSLKSAGWPPVFVYLFDEPWLLIDRLFELVAPILGPDCLLESSMYGWALSRSTSAQQASPTASDGATAAAAEVGGNFPVPHRDNSFEEANLEDGTPTHLSTWMCVNDVGLDNGCMHILPKDADQKFCMSHDYWHERVAYPTAGLDLNQKLPTRKIKPPNEQVILNFPLDKALPIPAPRGSVLLWQPNCIHWGSSCSSSSPLPPRKSLAMTFRCSAHKRPISNKERDLMTRAQMRALTLEDRLVMVVDSILMYAKWFPSFKAFDLDLLRTGEGGGVMRDEKE
jgi:hypothetical protein